MNSCDKCYGQHLHRLLEEAWSELPGTWAGFDTVDLARLKAGFPETTETDEDWMRHKLYDACLEHVMSEARYTSPEGEVFYIDHDTNGKLALFPVELCDD